MAWKPKEKPLTQEEAIALARKDLAPNWHGCPPLFAGVRGTQGATVHPLDAAFTEGNWILLFSDPTELNVNGVRDVAAEWHQRYQAHRLGVILVLRCPFPTLNLPENTVRWLERHPCHFVVVHDADGLLSEAFQVSRQPKVLLLQKGRRILEQQGAGWLAGVETRIQSFLRETDPGLPLPPPTPPSPKALKPAGSLEFSNPALAFHGVWARDGARIVTADRNARLEFEMKATLLGLVAQCASNEPGHALITIELDGGAVYEEAAGADLTMTESGESAVKVRDGRLYHLLSLAPGAHRVILRFPAAHEMPVALFAVRFGDQSAV